MPAGAGAAEPQFAAVAVHRPYARGRWDTTWMWYDAPHPPPVCTREGCGGAPALVGCRSECMGAGAAGRRVAQHTGGRHHVVLDGPKNQPGDGPRTNVAAAV